jgi:hypothetical protein
MTFDSDMINDSEIRGTLELRGKLDWESFCNATLEFRTNGPQVMTPELF